MMIGRKLPKHIEEKNLFQSDIETARGQLRCYISRVSTATSLETPERFACRDIQAGARTMRKWIQAVSQFVTCVCGVMLFEKLLTAYLLYDYSNLWIVPTMFGLAITSELVGNQIDNQAVLNALSLRPAERSNSPQFRDGIGCSAIEGNYLPVSRPPDTAYIKTGTVR